MTTYRRYASGLLAQAVQSVLAQDLTDFEFVVADDASTDGTAAYLASVTASDPRVRVIRNARNVNSVALSLERCMVASDPSRRWISWMFDDCVLLPGALSKLVEAAGRRSAGVTYGVTEIFRPDGPPILIGEKPFAEVRDLIAGSSVVVPNGGMLIERGIFGEVGWYDPSLVLRRSCDWDLFRRMFQAGVSFEIIPDVLMQELGELQADSLRNAFTTDLSLMAKFMAARDAAGTRLGLVDVPLMPVDWIPPADWSSSELSLMRYMFVEYYLSVANIPRAFRWARSLDAELVGDPLLRENLLLATQAAGGERTMAAGAYAGIVFGLYRQSLQDRRA